MSVTVRIVKYILAIIGFTAFFGVFGMTGNIEMNIGNDVYHTIMAFVFIGVIFLCAWVNKNINIAIGLNDNKKVQIRKQSKRILIKHHRIVTMPIRQRQHTHEKSS